MRRADRLFKIINILRRRRTAATAALISRQLGVSERTVYRDIRDLVLAGTPIDGEAGVGYRLRPGFDLPPLMFDREEIEALVLGARMVKEFGDPALARASDAIVAKVTAVLPPDLAPLIAATRLFVPPVSTPRHGAVFALAREALIARKKLELSYVAGDASVSHRVVRPLGIFFWGRTWTLAAWCESRDDFRNFRVDRITDAALRDDTFEEAPGTTLRDMLARYGAEAGRLLDG